QYRTIWISDVHLGTKGCNAEMLIDFLDHVDSEKMYLVGDDFLPESSAACFYLADGSHLIPADRFDRADMLRWMFWEQYNHEPNVATIRFWMTLIGEDNLTDLQRAQLPVKRAAGDAALTLMDEHLAQTPFFAGGRFSLADIALYAYTHVCEEGGFELHRYPSVQAWIERVAALPGHIAITD
ncbi:MAG: glutathione S-transferase C-terminal domain-containing protein, partial [Sphingomonas sp.]|nr:glutathione S-transferase C-terminal domain-containing protein [Sphingomonas sp.]